MSGYQTIRYQRDGDIGTLTLARPGKRNAQNPLMWEELARLGAGLLADQTLRCLVVTGEGPAFSAGIDLIEGMAGRLAGVAGRPGDEHTLAAGRAAAGTFSWIPDLGCASVAAVRGHAYGAGLQLASKKPARRWPKAGPHSGGAASKNEPGRRETPPPTGGRHRRWRSGRQRPRAHVSLENGAATGGAATGRGRQPAQATGRLDRGTSPPTRPRFNQRPIARSLD